MTNMQFSRSIYHSMLLDYYFSYIPIDTAQAVCKDRLVTLHCESEKNWTLSFEHNFGKYCPILIIVSLLQTEIKCDQAYPKIYHHTSSLLVHYLVK